MFSQSLLKVKARNIMYTANKWVNIVKEKAQEKYRGKQKTKTKRYKWLKGRRRNNTRLVTTLDKELTYRQATTVKEVIIWIFNFTFCRIFKKQWEKVWVYMCIYTRVCLSVCVCVWSLDSHKLVVFSILCRTAVSDAISRFTRSRFSISMSVRTPYKRQPLKNKGSDLIS